LIGPAVLLSAHAAVVWVALSQFLNTFGVTPLTFPFNLTILSFCAASLKFGYFPYAFDLKSPLEPQAPRGETVSAVEYELKDCLLGVVRGVGQVFFAGMCFCMCMCMCMCMCIFCSCWGSY
jgi:urea transporter